MSNEEIKKIYIASERFLSLLGSEYGEKIRKEKPELITLAERIKTQYQHKYMDIMIKEKPESADSIADIVEVKNALKLIPHTSFESIKELNDIITSESEKLQNILLFNPKTFYDKYFMSLVAPATDVLATDVQKNDRFIEWFNGSKVLGSDQKPLVVYHGTGGLTQEFNEFKFSPFPATYFAENKSYSDWFAELKKGNSIVHKCYLRVLNPIDLTPFHLDKITYEDFLIYIKLTYNYDLPESPMIKEISDKTGGMWAWRYLRMGTDWLNYIKTRGEFDGFSYYENNPDDQVGGKENVTKAWMVFQGNQIKSADLRNTTYSLNSNSISMQKGGKA